MGISIGCINSSGIMKCLDSSSLKVFVMGHIIYYIHLGDWVVIAEDAVEVSIFNAI